MADPGFGIPWTRSPRDRFTPPQSQVRTDICYSQWKSSFMYTYIHLTNHPFILHLFLSGLCRFGIFFTTVMINVKAYLSWLMSRSVWWYTTTHLCIQQIFNLGRQKFTNLYVWFFFYFRFKKNNGKVIRAKVDKLENVGTCVILTATPHIYLLYKLTIL